MRRQLFGVPTLAPLFACLFLSSAFAQHCDLQPNSLPSCVSDNIRAAQLWENYCEELPPKKALRMGFVMRMLTGTRKLRTGNFCACGHGCVFCERNSATSECCDSSCLAWPFGFESCLAKSESFRCDSCTDSSCGDCSSSDSCCSSSESGYYDDSAPCCGNYSEPAPPANNDIDLSPTESTDENGFDEVQDDVLLVDEPSEEPTTPSSDDTDELSQPDSITDPVPDDSAAPSRTEPTTIPSVDSADDAQEQTLEVDDAQSIQRAPEPIQSDAPVPREDDMPPEVEVGEPNVPRSEVPPADIDVEPAEIQPSTPENDLPSDIPNTSDLPKNDLPNEQPSKIPPRNQLPDEIPRNPIPSEPIDSTPAGKEPVIPRNQLPSDISDKVNASSRRKNAGLRGARAPIPTDALAVPVSKMKKASAGAQRLLLQLENHARNERRKRFARASDKKATSLR